MLRTFGSYVIGDRLGKGGQGKVFLCRHVDENPLTATPKALKVILLDRMNEKQLRMLEYELEIMCKLSHPNIIKFDDVLNHHKYTKKNGTKLNAFGIVSEVARGGELFGYLMKGPFPVEMAKAYFRQLMETIAYCHSQGVAHRDLKPENLLLDDYFNLKVIDFGMAKIAHEGDLTRTHIGTKTYMSPEVFGGRGGYEPFKMDIWACGILFFIFLFGVPPINNPDRSCWFTARIADEKYDSFWNGHKKYITNPALTRLIDDIQMRDLIQSMLKFDPTKRSSAAEILSHPYLASIVPDGEFIAAEMRRRKAQIDEEKHREAVKKEAERRMKMGGGHFDTFSLDTKRAAGSVEETGPAPLPLPEGSSTAGRMYDVYSDKLVCEIKTHICDALKEIGATYSEKDGYKFKARVESVEGNVVVFNSQIFYDGEKKVNVIAVDRREGSIMYFQSVYNQFLDHLGGCITAAPSI